MPAFWRPGGPGPKYGGTLVRSTWHLAHDSGLFRLQCVHDVPEDCPCLDRYKEHVLACNGTKLKVPKKGNTQTLLEIDESDCSEEADMMLEQRQAKAPSKAKAPTVSRPPGYPTST